jgi:hypothetical protein
MTISNNTKEELNQLLIELNKIHSKKEEIAESLKKELETKHVDLLAINNNVYNIYVGFKSEKTDIKEIAESIGYKLEKTFKKENGYIYQLTTKPRK